MNAPRAPSRNSVGQRLAEASGFFGREERGSAPGLGVTAAAVAGVLRQRCPSTKARHVAHSGSKWHPTTPTMTRSCAREAVTLKASRGLGVKSRARPHRVVDDCLGMFSSSRDPLRRMAALCCVGRDGTMGLEAARLRGRATPESVRFCPMDSKSTERMKRRPSAGVSVTIFPRHSSVSISLAFVAALIHRCPQRRYPTTVTATATTPVVAPR